MAAAVIGHNTPKCWAMAIILALPLGVARSARTLAEIPLEEFIIPVGLTVDLQSVPPMWWRGS